jgi:hypothetical protein
VPACGVERINIWLRLTQDLLVVSENTHEREEGGGPASWLPMKEEEPKRKTGSPTLITCREKSLTHTFSRPSIFKESVQGVITCRISPLPPSLPFFAWKGQVKA